ncbi:MAG TPA: CfrBI family restriction endonuclease [Atribacterota bacterium]|nr:CfrBI family restriction endonuclease [Atribacterota bacterium]
MSQKITSFIPPMGVSLAKYTGKQVVERIGEVIIKNAVTSVLCGENVRSYTEEFTRRRLTLCNASLFMTFLKSVSNIDNFLENMPSIIKEELLIKKIPEGKRVFLEWFIGLTGKSIQNVLRDKESGTEEMDEYLKTYQKTINDAMENCKIDFGNIEGHLNWKDINCNVNWKFFLYLFSAIGAQTLAIRGSEKSLYGKLFEKLVLASFLTILGFKMIDKQDISKSEKVFWLSSKDNDKRESDATLLYKPGVGVRFDIGFIGRGNPEISLDKVSRFEREMEHGRQKYYMSTIIIVDKIGEGSRIVNLAKNIKGNIVQMSMAYWVKEICKILEEKINFKHKLLTLSNEQTLDYIKEEIQNINLNNFVK